MKKLFILAITVGLMVTILGCGSLKQRVVFDVEDTLFVNISKSDDIFKVESLHDVSGDVNLKTLQMTSDAASAKLCGSKDNLSCIDKVIDVVAQTVPRESILKAYNHLTGIRRAHVTKLDEIHDKFKDEYKEEHPTHELAYLINDETSFYKGEKIPFKEIAYVGVNTLKYPDDVYHREEIHNMFPHPIEDFQANMELLQADLDLAYIKDIKVYNRNIRYRSSFYPIIVDNKTPKVRTLSMRVQAPKRLKRGAQDKSRVLFHITGVDFKNVFPYKFEGKNRDMKVVFDKKHITFKNLGKKDINLEAITLIYNGYNHSILLGDNFSFSLIKVHASTSAPSKVFMSDNLKKGAFFPALTKMKTMKMKSKFGIKLKYKVAGESKVRLLSVSKKELLWHSISGW